MYYIYNERSQVQQQPGQGQRRIPKDLWPVFSEITTELLDRPVVVSVYVSSSQNFHNCDGTQSAPNSTPDYFAVKLFDLVRIIANFSLFIIFAIFFC